MKKIINHALKRLHIITFSGILCLIVVNTGCSNRKSQTDADAGSVTVDQEVTVTADIGITEMVTDIETATETTVSETTVSEQPVPEQLVTDQKALGFALEQFTESFNQLAKETQTPLTISSWKQTEENDKMFVAAVDQDTQLTAHCLADKMVLSLSMTGSNETDESYSSMLTALIFTVRSVDHTLSAAEVEQVLYDIGIGRNDEDTAARFGAFQINREVKGEINTFTISAM